MLPGFISTGKKRESLLNDDLVLSCCFLLLKGKQNKQKKWLPVKVLTRSQNDPV